MKSSQLMEVLMASKLEKMAKQMNENFRILLAEKFKEKFELDIGTTFNVFTLTLVSRREDGQDFTLEQAEFIKAFESGYVSGYVAATDQVHA